MKLRTFLFQTIGLLGCSSVTTIAASTIRAARDENSLLCLIVETHEMQELGPVEYLECELILDNTVVPGLRIELPEDLVNMHHKALYRGEWFVKIAGATVQREYVESHGMVPSAIHIPGEAPQVVTIAPEQGKSYLRSIEYQQAPIRHHRTLDENKKEEPHRKLQSIGTRTLMVVRVSVTDSSPAFTASQLAEYYFDPNSFSLVRQYNWCSFGALQFTSYDSSEPVLDVFVPGYAANFTNAQLWPLAMAVGATQKNVAQLTSLAQHIAFVLPSGLGGTAFYAVGTVGFWRSLYSDTWGGYPNFAMHELGHNLGMGHAGVGTDQYADSSDIMGYGDGQQFGISKCFNGFHLWYLQWFASKSIEVTNPYNTTTAYTLVDFPDYNLTTSNQYVVIKVDVYHLVYNRAKGINYGVNDAIDMVTVAETQAGEYSVRVAVLDNTTAPFQVPNYGGGSLPLIIQVCSLTKGNVVDYAMVSIGVGVSFCNSNNKVVAPITASTPRPTPIPTLAPTSKPTPRPTPLPTLAPTLKPTPLPTLAPTFKPTPLPTLAPTLKPTPLPTLAPTLSIPVPLPTPLPTLAPTLTPILAPTTKPVAPTPKPVMAPTSKPIAPTLKPVKPTSKPTSHPTLRPTSPLLPKLV